MKNVIEISNFYWRFPTITGIRKEFSLKNITIEVRKGEVFGISGSTSSGKSTLCYVIAGLIPHQLKIPKEQLGDYFSGIVKILGQPVAESYVKGRKKVFKLSDLEFGRVGFVKQDPESHYLNRTIAEEFEDILSRLDISRKQMKERIKDSMNKVGLGDLFADSKLIHTSELSSGENQRIEIAKFLAMKPDILILDEPTSDLDPEGKAGLIETIHTLKKESEITIVLVEHDPDIMKRFADRMAVIHSGEIVMLDTPEKIYSNEKVRSYIEIPKVMEILGDGKLIHSKVDPRKVKGFKVHRPKDETGEVVLESQNLNFSYEDGTIALNDINLRIRKGEFIALVGQNGSGKSTLSKVISGLQNDWEGLLRVFGKEMKSSYHIPNWFTSVGYVYQNPDQQVLNGTVKDVMLASVKKVSRSETKSSVLMQDMLKRVNLIDKMNDYVNSLSRGERRRLALASVLATNPQILIVDEPATGQDYRSSREVMDLLSEVNERGVTVIIITHDMRLVAEYTRRVVVMKSGSIIFDGTPESLFKNDEIMKLSSLIPPQAVQVSRQLKESGIINDILLNAKEWLAFFEFEREKKKYIALKFEDLKVLSKKMAQHLMEKYGKPALIIYIERGGMVIGRLLSDYLEVKDMQSIKASYYTDDGVPSGTVNISDFNIRTSGKDGYVLLVDDIADTGKTLEAVLEVLRKRTTSEIVVTTAIYKPQSIIKPDVFAYTVDNDTWIVFDYEENETLTRFVRRDNRDGLKFMEDNFMFSPKGMKVRNNS